MSKLKSDISFIACVKYVLVYDSRLLSQLMWVFDYMKQHTSLIKVGIYWLHRASETEY
jgi:hypothetical protein